MRGLRFVRPALILTDGDGAERRLLAELDDKPWAAEDGESWRAAFMVESADALAAADRLELSVAPDVNIALRSDGTNADGPIGATGRVSEEPPPSRLASTLSPAPPSAAPASAAPASAASDPPGSTAAVRTDVPGPVAPRHRRARGTPAASTLVDSPTTADRADADAVEPVTPTPRPRPAPNRAADVERVTARLRAAEASLEREQSRREELEQSLDRERSDARRTAAELARAQAELELARTAEREAGDTATLLDATRREHHELRARHESLRSDHDQLLRNHAELEERLTKRTAALQSAREDLTDARRLRQEAESRAGAAVEAAVGSGHRPPVVHPTPHNPPLPRTDRPLNPSLRQSAWLRLLVVIVLAGVLLAVYLVLHSTVLH